MAWDDVRQAGDQVTAQDHNDQITAIKARVTAPEVSSAIDAALDGFEAEAGNGIPPGGAVGQALVKSEEADYAASWTALTKTHVGLTNVDNTADSAKPVSSPVAAALADKLSIEDVPLLEGSEHIGVTSSEPGVTVITNLGIVGVVGDGVSVMDGVATITAAGGGAAGIPAGGASGQVLTKASSTDYDAEWVTPTGGGGGGGGGGGRVDMAEMAGYRTWSYDLAVTDGGSQTAPSDGTLYLVKVPVPSPIEVSQVSVYVQGAGAGLTSAQFSFYTAAFERIATKAETPSAYHSTGLVSATFDSSVELAGDCYVGLSFEGTTRPTLYRAAGAGLSNAGTGLGNPRAAACDSVSGGAHPATAVPAATYSLLWVAVK